MSKTTRDTFRDHGRALHLAQSLGPSLPAGGPPRAHIRTLLREFRETYHVRLAALSRSPRPYLHATLPVSDLVECMRASGCTISAWQYRQVEAGRWLPDALEPLLDSLAHCLLLDAHQCRDLLAQIIFTRLELDLGREAALLPFQRREPGI